MSLRGIVIGFRTWRVVITLLFLAGLSGCGSPYSGAVHGIVTLDGKALDYGVVQFHPLAEGPSAYGNILDAGAYELGTGSESGIVPGKYKVTVMSTERPPTDLPVGVAPPIAKRISPERYGTLEQTPFEFEVKDGENSIDLEMTSK